VYCSSSLTSKVNEPMNNTNDDMSSIEAKCCRDSNLSEILRRIEQCIESSPDKLDEFVRQIPKIELHVHLDGAFDHEYLYECYCAMSVKDSNLSKVDFLNRCECRGKYSLGDMIQCFETFLPIVQGNLDILQREAYEFVRRQAEQHIVYTEVRYSPHLFTGNRGSYEYKEESTDIHSKCIGTETSPDAVVDAITNGLIRGEKEFGVQVNQIICCISGRPDWTEDSLRIASGRRNGRCAIVGIDIAAGEDHFDKVTSDLLNFFFSTTYIKCF